MKNWPDTKLRTRLNIDLPIIQAPMAGVDTPQLAAAVSGAGGLGSLACALLTPSQVLAAWKEIRAVTARPVNLNFFCHQQKVKSPDQQARWRDALARYYAELGLDIAAVKPAPTRAPFDETFCRVVEEIRPEVVSFHFGLPATELLARVRQTGATILSSATTPEEAQWLEQQGCDAIIAQGVEAGGHRGMFLTDDLSTQTGTLPLVRQVSKAVSCPVIAAGGIADAAGIKAALEAGAAAVQIGTAYLFCPEAKVSPLYKSALKTVTSEGTAITNIYSGRPARGIANRFITEMGGMSRAAPDFPYASDYVMPLRRASEERGSTDFMQMWSGTAARLCVEADAASLTRKLAAETLAIL